MRLVGEGDDQIHDWNSPTPHFARTREEELVIGWRETGIEVIAPPQWAVQVSGAMDAEKQGRLFSITDETVNNERHGNGEFKN